MKNIGLIGIGKMGLSHLAIANQTPGIKVEAICDTSKQLLRVIEKNTSFQCFTDYKAMIKKCSLDGVMILTPNSFHYDIAQYCLDQGLDIFVEKPLTLNYSTSKKLVASASNQNRKGQVGYVNRYNPVFQRVKTMIDGGVIGNVTNYINKMTGGVVLKENKGWRNDYAKGGGCLHDYGPHCFDLSTYLFGTDVKVTSAVLKKIFSTNVDDAVYATLIHKDQVAGVNYINWSDSSVRKATNNVEIFGDKGKITAGKQEVSVFLNSANPKMELQKGWNQLYITDENLDVAYYLRGEDFSRQLEDFSDLLNGNILESRASLSDASITDRIIEEIKSLSGKLL
ncbi:Gfo/Idh/MocA family oxidoreductase [Aquimarina sp. ERC-38]|uniref:Gfo/Idh/MocA family protein n=1 Tax=Aquimarina sp. ERC-38 TaxID=2949996 RepID=UPI0022451F2C|nr:Gfo/Idh/MocA family oxidoreductase [Aquimarina sp. ERC-38]UZO81458.1 Gfo/Idh/MocA family oxidoreductase [Aquimarina sp. ERC-38]